MSAPKTVEVPASWLPDFEDELTNIAEMVHVASEAAQEEHMSGALLRASRRLRILVERLSLEGWAPRKVAPAQDPPSATSPGAAVAANDFEIARRAAEMVLSSRPTASASAGAASPPAVERQKDDGPARTLEEAISWARDMGEDLDEADTVAKTMEIYGVTPKTEERLRQVLIDLRARRAAILALEVDE